MNIVDLYNFLGKVWEFVNKEWFLGVIIGFAIGEVSSWIRAWRNTRKIKTAIRDELRANQWQIPQKQDIIKQMITALQKQSYLPGRSVPSLTAVFNNHYPSVMMHYNSNERDNLHLIYGRLKVNESFMEDFEQKFKEEIAGGALQDPWTANISQLRDIYQSYGLIVNLINAFLKGKPVDVFYRHSGKEPPTAFFH